MPTSRLSDDILDRHLEGRCLPGRTLREAAGDRALLVIFLRHFG